MFAIQRINKSSSSVYIVGKQITFQIKFNIKRIVTFVCNINVPFEFNVDSSLLTSDKKNNVIYLLSSPAAAFVHLFSFCN